MILNPVTERDRQRNLAFQLKGSICRLVSPKLGRDGTLQVELYDGEIKQIHRRYLELSMKDSVMREQAELKIEDDS